MKGILLRMIMFQVQSNESLAPNIKARFLCKFPYYSYLTLEVEPRTKGQAV